MPERERLAELLSDQARHCEALGSPLYAALLRSAAEDARAGGPTLHLLGDDPAPGPRGNALALRLMAAAHRLALDGRAPALAVRLPSTRERAGERDDHAAAWKALRDLIVDRMDELRPLVAQPCQTNEVGRAAALAYGFFEAAASGSPLRLLELGASAGLNLRFDHFRYGGGGALFGPADSPVDLVGLWREPPLLPPVLRVAERLGCDRRPIDATSEEGQLTLLASVWADQPPRLGRLRGAIEVARRVPASVEAADASDWLTRRLSEPSPGRASIVYHSIVEEYLEPATRESLQSALREAGTRATREAPLFWLRLEPLPDASDHAVRLTRWPGGEERLLALASAHGADVRRPGAPPQPQRPA